jgi:gamma-glutamylaminecyclotransferase
MRNSSGLLHVPRPGALFVYGSLCAGEPNHRLLLRATLVGTGRTEPRFTLHDHGAFPAMVAGGMQAIVGEVYEVDDVTLAALDRLEGVPTFYQRVPIALADGGTAETYTRTSAQVARCPIVASGDWRAHRKEKSRCRS